MENTTSSYPTVMPYLIVQGAEKLMQFLQDVFGATISYKEMRTEDVVMHAEMKIGDSVIMLADSTGDHPQQAAGMFINVGDADTTFQKALDNGATIITPLSDQSYGRTGGVKDPFGNTWWITSAK